MMGLWMKVKKIKMRVTTMSKIVRRRRRRKRGEGDIMSRKAL
jgi:hypothetical protein